MGLKKSGRVSDGFAQSLISFIVNVSLPALTLRVIHQLSLDLSLIFPLAVPLLVFALSLGIILLLSRVVAMSRETIGCLLLMCGIGNTSIIGIPIIDAFYGSQGYGAALVVDQSNFIVMCVAGIVTAGIFGSTAAVSKSILKRIVNYPSIQAMALALLLKPFVFPVWLSDLLLVLGQTLTPLAMIALGVSFKLDLRREIVGHFCIGIGVKLLLIPFIIIAAFYSILAPGDLASRVALLQSGMPPMILAGLIAVDNKLNPPLALTLVALGIPISFLTLTMWHRVLGVLW
jgi:predicted permease